MKKNRFFYLAMMLCTLALGLTSCEKDDDENGGGNSGSEELVGYWEVYSTTLKFYYDGEFVYEEEGTEDYGGWGNYFDSDGKLYEWEYDGEMYMDYVGKYTYKDGKITVNKGEYSDTAKVTKLTESKLSYEYTETDEDGYKCVVTVNFRKVDL